MRYVHLCVISLFACLPLPLFAGPQPLEQIKIKRKTSCRAAWAMSKWIWPAAARWRLARR